jgi:hypothetical protein
MKRRRRRRRLRFHLRVLVASTQGVADLATLPVAVRGSCTMLSVGPWDPHVIVGPSRGTHT